MTGPQSCGRVTDITVRTGKGGRFRLVPVHRELLDGFRIMSGVDRDGLRRVTP